MIYSVLYFLCSFLFFQLYILSNVTISIILISQSTGALFLSHLVAWHSELLGFFLSCVVQNLFFIVDDRNIFSFIFPFGIIRRSK